MCDKLSFYTNFMRGKSVNGLQKFRFWCQYQTPFSCFSSFCASITLITQKKNIILFYQILQKLNFSPLFHRSAIDTLFMDMKLNICQPLNMNMEKKMNE